VPILARELIVLELELELVLEAVYKPLINCDAEPTKAK
jgi:hypothetical protein